MQMNFPQDVPSRLHSVIGRGTSENGRIPILRDKPIRLIRWPKARLENLLITPLPQKKN